jgi:PAS domain S-box-containing protein
MSAEAARGIPFDRSSGATDYLYRHLVESIHDYAIYLLDLDGRVSSWNPGAQRFKGYRASEVLGQHFSLFYTAEDRASGKPARALRIAREEGRFEDIGWRLRKDGTQFWANVVIDPVHDDRGTRIGFAKITRDITERRAAEQRVRDLTSSHQELEQFIHIASHDLREPLRKVLAFSDLLLEDEGDRLSAGSRLHVDSIMSATRRMQGLLGSLLDLTRVTSQGGTLDPCALDEVLSDVCGDLQILIGERGATLEIGPLPQIEADAAQMRQLFQNLIENSIKYAHASRAPHIVIAQQPEAHADFVSIVCRDNGIGFDPQYAERIFGVFQRLHPRDRYAGAGIGLSICRKICNRHGGSITARGRPDEGAEFHIRLRRRHRPDEL